MVIRPSKRRHAMWPKAAAQGSGHHQPPTSVFKQAARPTSGRRGRSRPRRRKCWACPWANVYGTLQTYSGRQATSITINLLGHTFQVIAMGWERAPFGRTTPGLERSRPAPSSGAMVPLSSIVTFRPSAGPYKVLRYNLYPATDIQGEDRPGRLHRTGRWTPMERIARASGCPPGSPSNGPTSPISNASPAMPPGESFVLAVVFVFIFLAALYESLTLPLAVISDRSHVFCWAAMLGVNLRGTDNNILTQIGMGGADRTGRQERHSDSRVCTPGRRRRDGLEPVGRRGPRGAHQTAPPF